jgi:hypothetical protein
MSEGYTIDLSLNKPYKVGAPIGLPWDLYVEVALQGKTVTYLGKTYGPDDGPFVVDISARSEENG